jgi:hypothetical protein
LSELLVWTSLEIVRKKGMSNQDIDAAFKFGVEMRRKLRRLVDLSFQAGSDSEAVAEFPFVDELIDQVFPGLPPAPVDGE